MSDLSQSIVLQTFSNSNPKSSLNTRNVLSGKASGSMGFQVETEPHHLHIYSHKHNTHVTFTRPNKEPIISLSAGNLGFKKSRRGGFDPAYSVTKYAFERLIHTGVQFEKLELVLRGFGPGRDAAIKVLMSPEGKLFRERIIRVADSTRIKFGGTRSPRPRRL
ncbi:hypothetical protein HIM_07289 [Hirsutella minnesotensis 3608]|uniref:37S ribosomal protein S18, mitochondrial n=1 Tax=Hirsutella minnesotensis 3608 TaxID=1043627 RepID=A0A0F7ZN80_9HYPO|nr:hypothetical protein HIM_07289 [Hirsutella minnesotensis 3608]